MVGRRTNRFAADNFELFSEVGAILYELMHNTNDWARTDVDETALRKSIRGILFTRFILSEASIRKSAGSSLEIAGYMHEVEKRNPGQTIHLAELSVFDAGPGLRARWLVQNEGASEPTIGEEHEACVNCLGVHRTTSPDTYRGVGLYDVKQTSNRLSAVVRVRTG